jgi:uncharacterized membrane protein
MNRDAYAPRSGERLAVGLGWFSIALGVAELAAPHSVARLIGITPTERMITTLRSFGTREVSNGLAILAQPDRSTWLWSRVAGDVLDLATLGNAMTTSDTDRGRASLAAAAVLGVAALDVICAQQLSQQEHDAWAGDHSALGSAALRNRDSKVRVHEVVTINTPLERVEERWANLESMPESLRSLSRSTGVTGDERAIVEFRHAPGGRGTEVRVEIEYLPRGGVVGAALARLIGGDPTGQIRQDLRHVKQIIETGEVVRSDGPRHEATRRTLLRAEGEHGEERRTTEQSSTAGLGV